ncbi:Cystatin [Merluccius polli]|uniref:Cystatin n=1 Tax=Merluccius polli TaxID=89951 RepID=A0AA47N1Q9_MERPO|nr:Cystatin [Merluccius polli]
MIWKTCFLVAALAAGTGLAVMTGGYINATITDPEVQDAMKFALVKHNEGTNDMFLRQVARVIKAEQQLVSGMNYRFTVDLGKTACRKGGVKTECPIHEDPQLAQTYRCTFVVYRHWRGTTSLTSTQCVI